MAILHIFLLFLTIEAQSPFGSSNTESPSQSESHKDVVTNFKPSLAVVVGVLFFIFSLTFALLVYTKFCYRRPSSILNRPLVSGRSGSNSGIDKTLVESLPFFRFSALKGSRDGLECAVCLAKFDAEIDDVLRLLPCKHGFHIECIDKWLEKHSTCPLCRQTVTLDDISFFRNFGSFRFLRVNQTEPGDHETGAVELFVQRESSPSNSSRFRIEGNVIGGSFRKKKELPIQEMRNHEENLEGILHKFNHSVIVSDLVLKNRWSNVSSSDLLLLNSEMLRSISSNRFSSSAPDRDGDIRGTVNKTVDEGDVSQENLVHTSRAVMLNEERSKSEITLHPRFMEFSMRISSREDRRDWLSIARRTVQWCVHREKQIMNKSFNI